MFFFFFFLGQLELFECGLYARWCLLNCSNVVFPRCGNSVVVMWKRVLVWRTGMLRYLGMKHQCLQLTFRWSGKNEKGMYKYRASQSLNGKESTCQCRRHRFDPWVGKTPWRRRWQPILVFLPGEFYGQRSLVGYSLWGCKESGMTKQLSIHIIMHIIFISYTDSK